MTSVSWLSYDKVFAVFYFVECPTVFFINDFYEKLKAYLKARFLHNRVFINGLVFIRWSFVKQKQSFIATSTFLNNDNICFIVFMQKALKVGKKRMRWVLVYFVTNRKKTKQWIRKDITMSIIFVSSNEVSYFTQQEYIILKNRIFFELKPQS